MTVFSPNAALSEHQAAAELAAGLLRPQPQISPKFFYDALGSKLFEAICELDEYYLTRAEAEILAGQSGEIAARTGTGVTLIDLGAGNCAKAEKLFPALRPECYVPVDISTEFLAQAAAGLRARNPGLPVIPLALDFSEQFSLPANVLRRPKKLFFYPGSSLGNFSHLAALQFLRRLRAACGTGDGLLLGVDLVKEAATLEAAYDDALGVTAAFNLNVLRNVNRILQSDFEMRHWGHVAFYNAAQSRMEMHLRALENVTVRWPGQARGFAAGERIHTENSHKFTPAGIENLLREAGFGEIFCWTGRGQKFLVCHARAV